MMISYWKGTAGGAHHVTVSPPHAEEGAQRPSRSMRGTVPALILRDAVLRTAPQDEGGDRAVVLTTWCCRTRRPRISRFGLRAHIPTASAGARCRRKREILGRRVRQHHVVSTTALS